jgi:hypothetical protein
MGKAFIKSRIVEYKDHLTAPVQVALNAFEQTADVDVNEIIVRPTTAN